MKTQIGLAFLGLALSSAVAVAGQQKRTQFGRSHGFHGAIPQSEEATENERAVIACSFPLNRQFLV